MKKNDEETNEVSSQLENDEESSSKLEKDNSKKSLKIKFDLILAIIWIIAVIVCIICSNIKEKKKENDTCKNEKINVNGKWIEITSFDKPIIYLYPTEEIQVNVQLGNKEQITCSYPKYTIGWNVIAQPNGDLKDIDTNKNLYSLYYESDNVVEFKVEKDGFVVKGEDSAEFLEEKLKILGLTDREAEEFIIYWLPKLEANK